MSSQIDTAPNYVDVEQARAMPGIRIAFTRGTPGPWSVAARAILDIKGIDYISVPQDSSTDNAALKEWTGQTSAPVLMRNDDRIRTQWSEMLVLAEQLQPEPPLIPDDEDERAMMFGICHEICADDGLGWNIRLLAFSDQRKANETLFEALFDKYGSPVTYDHIVRRLTRILTMLERRLEKQAAAGSRYFIGDRLTAADIYWAAFSNLFRVMPDELCLKPDFYIGLDAKLCAHLDAPPADVLFDHRDHVVRTYFRMPIAL